MSIYRIEIQSRFSDHKFFFWIGPNLTLVNTMAEAVEVSEQDSLMVMATIDMEAVCFREA